MTKSWHLDRRTFLRGTGVAMALPMLEAMAHGADDPAKKQPRRMACVFFPNGVSLPPKPEQREWYWFPEGSGHDYQLSKTLSPLEPHRQDITILGGTEHFNSRGLHGHHACDIWLTGADIRKSLQQLDLCGPGCCPSHRRPNPFSVSGDVARRRNRPTGPPPSHFRTMAAVCPCPQLMTRGASLPGCSVTTRPSRSVPSAASFICSAASWIRCSKTPVA